MNFFINSILSILAVSVYASDSCSNSRSDCESSLCSDSSSSNCGTYLSSDSSPRLCAKELAIIEAQPCLPAVNYMKKMEAEVRDNARAWFLEATRDETIKAFATNNGIVVKVYNAFGAALAYPSGTLIPFNNDFSVLRSQALNKGVYDAGMGIDAYYAFPIITPEGSYVMVQFVVPRSQLPLNNIRYKRGCHYN